MGGNGLVPCLLLTTTGRRSGRRSTMPLFYGEAPSGYIVVGSKGGLDTHPGWHLNLLADPNGGVQVRERHYRIRARTAEGEERVRLWSQMVELFPPYANYQQLTKREIPVVLLERI